MALSRASVAVFFTLLLCMGLGVSAHDDFSSMLTGRRLQGTQINCESKCGYRCSKASRAKLCFKDCCACCKTCSCVPPGTAGNREMCPCYANLKNSKGTGKCP